MFRRNLISCRHLVIALIVLSISSSCEEEDKWYSYIDLTVIAKIKENGTPLAGAEVILEDFWENKSNVSTFTTDGNGKAIFVDVFADRTINISIIKYIDVNEYYFYEEELISLDNHSEKIELVFYVPNIMDN